MYCILIIKNKNCMQLRIPLCYNLSKIKYLEFKWKNKRHALDKYK